MKYCIFLAHLMLFSGPAAAETLILRAEEDFTISAEINGALLRLRVDPGASGLLSLNPDAARRARLKPELQPTLPGYHGRTPRRAYAVVGPVRLEGRTSKLDAAIGGQRVPLRAIWFERKAVEGADGIISVAHLPFDKTLFQLAPHHSGHTDSVVDLDYTRYLGLHHRMKVAGDMVAVRLSLHEPDNVATAAAGALLSQDHGGAWIENSDRKVALSFGIVRPVRLMRLARPFVLSGVRADSIFVRLRDHRGHYLLPSELPSDPDEIVVTATNGGQPARLSLVIGRQQFSRCSSLSYEQDRRRLKLRCGPLLPQQVESLRRTHLKRSIGTWRFYLEARNVHSCLYPCCSRSCSRARHGSRNFGTEGRGGTSR